ncbi:MAG: cupin domain-containing protein [Meiothermus sp.]|nr:cupin domain-containing protein [Meiothermus sp.]
MPTVSLDLFAVARENTLFQREILTNLYSQVVLMSLEPGEDIGRDTHPTDRLLLFLEGTGEAELDGDRSEVFAGCLVAVPAATRHTVINTGDAPLKLVTFYAPPEEAPGTMHKTRAEAVEAAALRSR